MKITVEVCDVCQREPVRTWRVAAPGARLRQVSLCSEHEKPLLDLPGESAPKGRGRRRVVPREEIERKRK